MFNFLAYLGAGESVMSSTPPSSSVCGGVSSNSAASVVAPVAVSGTSGAANITQGVTSGGIAGPTVSAPIATTGVTTTVPTPSSCPPPTTPASVGAASTADHFCLRWNNYQTNMTTVFDQLLQEEVFVDVTLSCDGGAQLRAHKVVLAACSPYFQAVLQHNPCKHPIIIMPRDVVFADLRAIIEFVYRGEIDVAQEQINSLLQAAEILKIKGLCEVTDDPSNMPPGFTATPSTRPAPTTNGVQNSTASSGYRGRPPITRGRYGYRPRGRPPLYGRTRYDRPGLASRNSSNLRDQPSKRIKTEMGEEDMSSGGGLAISGNNSMTSMSSGQSSTHSMSSGDMHRNSHHAPHYMQQNQHNDENASGVSHSGAEYDAYYVKSEEHQHQQSQASQQGGHMGASGHLQPDPNDPTGQRMTVTPELLGLMPQGGNPYNTDSDNITGTPTGRKLWTDEDMDKALDALRNSQMSLSKAAQVYGIPATTLWQRAHRMGIETPKKEGANKTWSEHDLAGALEELRSGRLSANRASKEFGIPNSTLYKIARKEGIKLSSPFSAIQPSWNPEDLNRALDAIRGGMSVQKSAQEFGIPTGTLYGRCRREGIELSKYQGVPWSEEDMKDALEVVRVGEMSINQAAIHYNLPYSSLYGRFKRGKYEDGLSHQDFLHQEMTIEHYSSADMTAVQPSNMQTLQAVGTSITQQQQQPTPPPSGQQPLSSSAPPDQY